MSMWVILIFWLGFVLLLLELIQDPGFTFFSFKLKKKKKFLALLPSLPKAVLDRYAFQSQWPVALPMDVI